MEDDDAIPVMATARRLIDRHGKQAPDVAATWASRMERIGDVTRRTHWLCVMISAQRMLVRRHGW